MSMPAIYGEDEPLEFPPTCTVEADWRKPGEALCPERYPIAKLRKYQRRLGGYFWGALFQQHPRPRAGTMFQREWFSIVDAAPADTTRALLGQGWHRGRRQGDGGSANRTRRRRRGLRRACGAWSVQRPGAREGYPADSGGRRARYGRVLVWIETRARSAARKAQRRLCATWPAFGSTRKR